METVADPGYELMTPGRQRFSVCDDVTQMLHRDDDFCLKALNHAPADTGPRLRNRVPGNTQQNSLPSPGSECTRRRASWRCNTCLTIASPSPVPPRERLREGSTR